MKWTFQPSPGVVAVMAMILFAGVSSAGSFSFTGNFSQDDDVQFLYFSIASPTSVTLTTLSYAGGVNAGGAMIAAGGFDPFLSLFDAEGIQIGTNNDGGCPDVGTDPVTEACWDSFLTATLGAGSYLVALTEHDNSPLGPTLADGFLRSGQGNFTGPEFTGQPGSFWDINPNQRDSHWAVDIRGADTASSVPEPGTSLLLSAGLAAAIVLGKRAKNQEGK